MKKLYFLLVCVLLSITTNLHAESYVLDYASEQDFSTINSVEYDLNGEAGVLTFEGKYGTILGVGGSGYCFLAQYVDGAWSDVATLNSLTTSYNTFTYTLNRKATKIKMYTTAGAVGRKYFKNVKVTRARYIEDNGGTNLNNFTSGSGADDVTTQSFSLVYSNAANALTATSSNSAFTATVSSTSVGQAAATCTVTVEYNPSDINMHQSTITVTDGVVSYTKAVVGLCAPQSIWAESEYATFHSLPVYWTPISSAESYTVQMRDASNQVVTEQTLTNNYLWVTGLTPGTNYTVRVCANYAGGYKSGYASAIIQTSNVIPAPATFEVGTVFENTEIPAKWAKVDDVVTYSVRAYDAAGAQVAEKTGITDTFAMMPALDPNGSYTFKVRADYKGFASDEIEYSPRCVVTPSGLTAEITDKTELTFTWTATTADGYELVVTDSEGNETALTAEAGENTLVVTDLIPATTYTAKLRGTTDTGNTPFVTIEMETWKLLPSEISIDESNEYFAQNVAWAAVEDADAYSLQLYAGEEQVFDGVVTDSLDYYFTELKPGTYTAKVAPRWNGYTFAYNNVEFTVAKAPLTVTALDTTRVYGSEDPEFTLVYAGWLAGHDTIVTAPSVVPESTIDSPAGEYALNLEGGNDDWYEYSFVSGKMIITKSDLHVSVADTARYYYAEDPAFRLIYEGFLLDDDTTVLQQQPVATTEATLESPIGSKWAITLAGGESDRYNFVFPEVPDTMTILQALTTISTDTVVKTYGDEPFELETNNVDKPLVYAVADEAVAKVVDGKITVVKPGATTITVSQEGSDNFIALEPTEVPLVVEKATITVTALDTMRLYGEANPEFKLAYTGFVNGEDASVITSAPVATTDAVAESVVGAYTITVSGGEAADYVFDYVSGILTINPLQTMMTIAAIDTLTYGDAPIALPVVNTNNTAGEIGYSITDETIAEILPDTTIAIKAAGATWVKISQTSGGSFTAVTDSVALVVKKAHLTVAVADTSRAYGEANPDFVLLYDGFIGNDTDSVLIEKPVAASEAAIDSDFGEYPIVISGGMAANYDFIYTEGAMLSINTARTVIPTDTIMAVYGDSLIVIPTNNNEGALHCVVADTTVARFADGRLSVVGAGATTLQVWQDSSRHYTSHYTDTTFVEVPLTIAKAQLTISPLDTVRHYLDANPVVSFAYDGFVYGEDTTALDAMPVAAIAAGDTTTVGEYVITADSARAANYEIAYNEATLTIIPAISTLDVAAIDTLTYGDNVVALPVAVKNNVERDLVYTTLDTTVAVVKDSVITICGVGVTSLIVTQEAGENYTAVSDTVEIVVEKALLTISVADTARAYGEANPEMEILYNGFVYAEDTAALAVKPVLAWEAVDTTSTGVYAITPQGAEAANYEFTYLPGKLTINPATTILAVAAPDTVVYGSEAVALEMTTNNTESEVLYSVTDPSVVEIVDGKFLPKRAGTTYVVAMQVASRNYTQAMTNFFTYTVEKAPLTISVADTVRAYGEENPQFSITYTGFVNDETAEVLAVQPVAATVADKASTVGEYAITVSGAEAANYDISYVDATLTIEQAVTEFAVAAPDTMVYGDAPLALAVETNNNESELSYVVEDSHVVKVEEGKLVIVAPGKTTVTVSQAASSNYTAATAVVVPVVVEKATLNVNVADATRAYGEANPEFVITYEGFVNNETAENLTSPAVATCAATEASVGTFPIVVSGAVSNNYDFIYTNGTLTIGAVTTTLAVAEIPAKTYGDLPFALPVVTSNNNRGEITYTIADESIAEIKNGRIYIKAAGNTSLIVAQAATDAYTAAETTVALNIAKAQLTVTADDVTINAGDEMPELSLTYKGFAVGEDVTALAVAPVASCETDGTIAGTYEITVSGGDDDNYEFVYVAGALTVNEVSGIDAADSDNVKVFIAGGNLHIEGAVAEVTLYNMNGAAVKHIVNPSSVESVSELAAGHYIAVARTADKAQKFRVVKK